MSMDRSTLRIGVSGHQQLGDEATLTFVCENLRELLTTYQQQARQHEWDILAYSSLAIGADQLFARTAIELGIPVEAVIPCSNYEETFSSADTRSEYHRLLDYCRQVHQLSVEICLEETYLNAGHWIVDHSDLLILIWDGRPPKSKGGTGDIASYARLRLPNSEEIVRDIVERPESVLVLPTGQDQTVLMAEEYDLGAGIWQLKLPGGRAIDPTPDGLRAQAEKELREELGYRAGKLEKLLDFYSHPGYIAHKVHLFVAQDLEWDPLEMEDQEEVRVHTLTLDEALAATRIDYRCDPEAALALWSFAGRTLGRK